DYRVKQMMSYIHKHFQDKITLGPLSQNIYLSEAEAIRLFKKYVKQTPFEYLLRYRLEQSKSILDKDSLSTITEIAMACGFSTTSYFIKVFKARYGMTPKQYQKYHHTN
ncbi:AraC family transcriptional regulator, partial [Staphylococcus saprophyticus]|uniref:helix-turn-helix transcriptional regulator n=5 Tax=Staphylococcus TaxID=1279 RepID=UPI0028A358D2